YPLILLRGAPLSREFDHVLGDTFFGDPVEYRLHVRPADGEYVVPLPVLHDDAAIKPALADYVPDCPFDGVDLEAGPGCDSFPCGPRLPGVLVDMLHDADRHLERWPRQACVSGVYPIHFPARP